MWLPHGAMTPRPKNVISPWNRQMFNPCPFSRRVSVRAQRTGYNAPWFGQTFKLIAKMDTIPGQMRSALWSIWVCGHNTLKNLQFCAKFGEL